MPTYTFIVLTFIWSETIANVNLRGKYYIVYLSLCQCWMKSKSFTILKTACLGSGKTNSTGKNAFFQGYGFTENGKIVFLELFIQSITTITIVLTLCTK